MREEFSQILKWTCYSVLSFLAILIAVSLRAGDEWYIGRLFEAAVRMRSRL